MTDRTTGAPTASETPTAPDTPTAPPRLTWPAVKRGLKGRCPACGEGRILHAYLSVHDACSACGEELHHQRADDFPPYLTIIVVAHVLAAAMLLVDDVWPDLPMAYHFAIWPTLCVLMCLWLLPIFKGALIAYQWALRMHGFETAHLPAKEVQTHGATNLAVGGQADNTSIRRSAAA